MNNLSWLLYLANVAGSIGAIAAIVAFFSLIGVIVGMMFYAGNLDVYEEEDWRRGVGSKITRSSILTFITCSVLLIFVPGRDTIYAIAASEVGEDILKSETGSLATKALNAWLQRQIEPEADAT